MRRAQGHLTFGLIAAALALLTLGEGLRLLHVQQVNRAVRTPANTATHALPEARLARAVALSMNDYDGALAAYKAVIQSDEREELRGTALYDLGNLHLRQALRAVLGDETQSLPLAELAKQSYRDELRRNPDDWDARYNLERALRLAPEEDEQIELVKKPPDQQEQQRVTIADPRMDLP